MKRYLLIVVQVSDVAPHDVVVNRRTVSFNSQFPPDERYTAVEPEVQRMLREGFSLSNWHLFEIKPSSPISEDTTVTVPGGKSLSKLGNTSRRGGAR